MSKSKAYMDGVCEVNIRSVRALMENLSLTAAEAMAMIDLSPGHREAMLEYFFHGRNKRVDPLEMQIRELARQRADELFQNVTEPYRKVAYESFIEGFAQYRLSEAFTEITINIPKLHDSLSVEEIADTYGISAATVQTILQVKNKNSAES